MSNKEATLYLKINKKLKTDLEVIKTRRDTTLKDLVSEYLKDGITKDKKYL